MSEKSEGGGAGVGFLGLLGLVFITLKLCGVIDWPWIWVLAPIWGGFALALVIVIIFVAFVKFADWHDARKRRRRQQE